MRFFNQISAVGIVVALALTVSAAASTKAELQVLVPGVKAIAGQSDIIAAVEAANQANEKLTATDIRTLEQEWKEGLAGKPSNILTQVNGSPLSSELKTLVAKSNGSYSDLLVTDSKGLVIGQTYNNDRYSEGKRALWSKINKEGVTAEYFGRAKSTSSGLVAGFGLPIIDNNKVIGAILVASKVVPAAAKTSDKKAKKEANS